MRKMKAGFCNESRFDCLSNCSVNCNVRNLRIHKGNGLVYLNLTLLSFLSLIILRMLRDYFIGTWKGNGQYFIFAFFNFLVGAFESWSGK